MICSTCKASNADGARFCSGCGADLRDLSPASAPNLDHGTAPPSDQIKSAQGPHDSLLGSIIAGKYRLSAKLGSGGMGAVYRATRLLIGDEVAVKLLHSEQSDPNTADRFRREAHAAARLKHPNAVAIYDFGVTEDGQQYLVMDFVEGESLRQIIREQGPLTPSASAEIIDQVCAALDEAHRHNIVHRDIKPDNIIVNSGPRGVRVKVLDFGIAKLREDAASNLTQTGSIVGTPHYMSPEQCLGEELDGRSDIYSLGIVLYEMLTGRVPFNSPISTAVVIQQVNQPPPPLRPRNSDVSVAAELVVLAALAKNREHRPQAAGELARQFSMAVNSPGNEFAPVATVGANNSVSVDQIPATTVLQGPFHSGSVTAPPLTKRISSRWLVAIGLALVMFSIIGGWLVLNRGALRQSGATSDLVSNNPGQNVTPTSFTRHFSGLVDARFKIQMSLRREGADLSGSYFYQPTNDFVIHGNFTGTPDRWADKEISAARMDVSVRGSVDEQRNFQMEETDSKGVKLGIFKGRFVSDTQIEGTWTKMNGKQPTPFSLNEDTSNPPEGLYRITAKQITRRKGKLKIDINYPQLEGLADNAVQKNFNERVRALVSNDLGGTSDEEGTHSIGFTIDYRSADMLSLIFGAFYEWEGAAHPQHHNFSYNYDLKHDREIKLADLFVPGSNHLGVISKLCARDIAREKQKNGMSDFSDDGEASAYDALKEDPTFYLTEKRLVFIFDPYQVGSYAEGYYVVAIPYSQLMKIINTEGPLASFIA